MTIAIHALVLVYGFHILQLLLIILFVSRVAISLTIVLFLLVSAAAMKMIETMHKSYTGKHYYTISHENRFQGRRSSTFPTCF
jgi:hypothetical protein